MSEMIDRVARELRERVLGGVMLPWDAMGDEHKAQARRIARIAIEAMREPTLYMLRRGAAVQQSDPTCLSEWQAMIDAALTE